MTDGLLVVDKPAGITSHDAVSRCRRIFGQKRVGHAGTLDPDATGVLLIGLGRATRLMQFMSGLDKTYAASIALGSSTTTLDAAGSVTGTWDMSGVDLEAVRAAAAPLTGPIMQVPPMVSAVKIGGRRLHELARAGEVVDRPARPVTVHRFDVLSLDDGVVQATIECSSGTYIRVLAADLGAALGGAAHVRTLRRTAVGPWTDADSVGLDDAGPEAVRPLADALPWLPLSAVTGEVAADVAHGKVLEPERLGVSGEGPWRIVDAGGGLLAVYIRHGSSSAKPAVVVAPAS